MQYLQTSKVNVKHAKRETMVKININVINCILVFPPWLPYYILHSFIYLDSPIIHKTVYLPRVFRCTLELSTHYMLELSTLFEEHIGFILPQWPYHT